MLQHIVYSGYLPAVIGRKMAADNGLLPLASGYFTGYDPKVNPAIYAEFATAAFRFGHSVVHNNYTRADSNNALIDNVLKFSNINFNTDEAYNVAKGGLDSILIGLTNSQCGRNDLQIASDLQNKLITGPYDMKME